MITSFLKIIFYCICYYRCPNFSPFATFHPASPLPQAIPTPLSMSMGPTYMSFGYSLPCDLLYIPITILYQFVVLNHFTFLAYPPNSPPTWQPSKCSLYLWFCFCSAYLFISFFGFNCWYTCIRLAKKSVRFFL